MKFNEMSWKELEQDFKRILANFSTEDLVETLIEYAINIEEYSYEVSNDNNLNEEYCFNEVNIEKEQTQIEVIKDKEKKKNTIEIDGNIVWGAAA